MSAIGVFHPGEQALQEQSGVRERLAHAAFIRDFMPQQHRDFFALLPFVVVGSVDAQGQPWASVLAGPPGFMRSPDERTLAIDALPAPEDPLAPSLQPGAALGLLGIQQHTRRRNRLNGHVQETHRRGFRIGVDQSFGNCPKYIQAREAMHVDGDHPAGPGVRSPRLDERACDIVRSADTFFIASAHPSARESRERELGVDVSHRGGKPGFVRVDDASALTVPDFTGNSYFNTLGNLLLEPRCGLLFIDFATGTTLQLAARARIVTDGPEVAAFRGALRLVRLDVEESLRIEHALPLRWGAAQPSPMLEPTGSWRGAG